MAVNGYRGQDVLVVTIFRNCPTRRFHCFFFPHCILFSGFTMNISFLRWVMLYMAGFKGIYFDGVLM